MSDVYSKALNTTISVDRFIGKIEQSNSEACLVFFGGIHGNEPSGVFALHQVFNDLEAQNIPISANVYGISGHLWALERSKRYQEKDLNRLWYKEQLDALKLDNFSSKNEDEKQQVELYEIIQHLFSKHKGPFYFFDLHTTSGETKPFLTVNDSLLNRKFTQQYPLPIILGIEEYLDGPLLSYINELGYISFGFESGQHDAKASIDNHIAFVYLSMVFAGAIKKEAIDFKKYFQALGNITGKFYEIYYKYTIQNNERFVMEPGFLNFEIIQKGQVLAKSNDQPILASENSNIFMPLYQSQGNDGYFLIRSIPSFYLKLSALLRRLKIDRILHILPGIKQSKSNQGALILNLKIARLFTKPFLHLLGYRSKTADETHLIIKSREINAKNIAYKHEYWFNRKHQTKPKVS